MLGKGHHGKKLKVLPGVPGMPVGTVGKDELLESATGPLWKTKDGEILSIKDMQDDHITNAILMLDKRRAVVYARMKSIAAASKALEAEVSSRREIRARAIRDRLRLEKESKRAAEQAAREAAKFKVRVNFTGRKFRED